MKSQFKIRAFITVRRGERKFSSSYLPFLLYNQTQERIIPNDGVFTSYPFEIEYEKEEEKDMKLTEFVKNKAQEVISLLTGIKEEVNILKSENFSVFSTDKLDYKISSAHVLEKITLCVSKF